jgi:uncharacterized protein YdaU (DUF1376 family)
MSALPWMPLYVADYLADTGHMTTVQHGAYLLLIMHYWRHGGLPNDEAQLAQICRMNADEWTTHKPLLKSLFSGGWKHRRVEFEMTEAARVSAAGRAGGLASAEARRKRTTVERPLNDRTNDPATIGQALPSPSPSPSPVSKEVRGPRPKRTRSQLDSDWIPTEADKTYARERGIREEQIEPLGSSFKNHHLAKGSAMADWHRAWCKWCDNEINWKGNNNGFRGSRIQDDSRSASRAAAELAEKAKRGEFTFGPRPGLSVETSGTAVRLLPKG